MGENVLMLLVVSIHTIKNNFFILIKMSFITSKSSFSSGFVELCSCFND